jgi:hypothetical protein
VNTASVLATIVLLPFLFVVPGWLALRRFGAEPVVALYCGLGATAAFAGATVGLAIMLPWSVRTTCIGGLAVLILSSAYCAITAPRPLLPVRTQLAGMIVFGAAFLAAAAFVAAPSDPNNPVWAPGTSGPGRVDSPRWAGLPSDNTVSYRTGQVAFHKQRGQLRDKFGDGWWVSDRTPLVGLAFAFSVGALDAHIRSDNPAYSSGQAVAMRVKDPYAYWLYNLVAVLMATALILGVFYLALVWRGNAQVATVAALVAALAPGLFLNEIYTWPKAAPAYFVLAGMGLALRRRAFGAGALAGLAYLCHPSAAFWIPSVAIVLLSHVTAARLRALARFVLALIVVLLPWQVFTSLYMHAFSRWLFWPLGAVVDTRTNLGRALSEAWRQFVERGAAGNVWVRVESTASSLFPTDLTAPGLANGMPHFLDAKVYWADAHGFSIWGMLGLVLFPATILFMARRWPRHRRMLALIVVPYVIVAIAAAGFPDTWSSQSAYPLVGLLAIFSAEMLLAVGLSTRWFLWAAIALELLTTAYVCEYNPFNAGVVTLAIFAVLGIGAHLALIAALGRAIGLGPRQLLRRRGRLATVTSTG